MPVDFPDRAVLAEVLTERTSAGALRYWRRSAATSARWSTSSARTRSSPSTSGFARCNRGQKAIAEALQEALTLEEPPRRIECFDISHIQGAETVASMVVWEDGAMKKSDYRKFQVRSVTGVDDFASMREIIHRRYKRLLDEEKPFPSLILIDGGLGQLHAAYAALEEIGAVLQPLASIAKREEIIYVHGQEDEPVVLDRRSPVLHLVQKIRDESHRFAVSYHRKRREMRDRESELDQVPGVGARTRQRLLQHFGSVRAIRQATPDALTAVVSPLVAGKIRSYFDPEPDEERADAAPLRVLQ